MKNIKACLIILLFCAPAIVIAQSKPDSSKINFIKAQFVDINSHISTYRKVHRDDRDQSTEGGEATAYFDGNELKKIGCTYYGEMGKSIIEYYFKNGELIFFVLKRLPVPVLYQAHKTITLPLQNLWK